MIIIFCDSSFPVDNFMPLQAAPTPECTRAMLLFKSLDALLDELARPTELKTALTAKSSKVRFS